MGQEARTDVVWLPSTWEGIGRVQRETPSAREARDLKEREECLVAHWQFRPLNPNETSGTSISEINFADEERTSVEILIRETLQNPLDARDESRNLVRVSYKLVSLDTRDSRFAQAIFTDDWIKHFQAGGLIAKGEGRPETLRFLVIEDFGTTGLEGCYTDANAEGRTENWNAFWFREGEGAKVSKSNGGAGQGKITLFQASKLRSVFALTRRKSDGKDLLFGCCRFSRNYKLEGDERRWARDARWGAEQDPNKQAIPITDLALLSAVRNELRLDRGHDPGTSFIVPEPDRDITEESLLRAVVSEFFFAIRRGRLVVNIGDKVLNRDSIAEVANQLGTQCRLSAEYRDFLGRSVPAISGAPIATAEVSWVKVPKLAETVFGEGRLGDLRDKFARGELIYVDFPVNLRRINSKEKTRASFRVVLQSNEAAGNNEELFVRQDLGIDGERKLRGARTALPVMALTFIDDPELSDFLVSAEEPTHRKWNARLPKVAALYQSPGEVLNAVRNAALRLVSLISPEGKRDETALSGYFSDPSSSGFGRAAGGGSGGASNRGVSTETANVPKANPKPLSIAVMEEGFEVRGREVEGVKFPLQCRVEMAYATLIGDAFKNWDAADFWIGDERVHPVTHWGVSDIKREFNCIDFLMAGPAAGVRVMGFDPRRQLEIRVKFKEVPDGSDDKND
jgi:hypothetical protein